MEREKERFLGFTQQDHSFLLVLLPFHPHDIVKDSVTPLCAQWETKVLLFYFQLHVAALEVNVYSISLPLKGSLLSMQFCNIKQIPFLLIFLIIKTQMLVNDFVILPIKDDILYCFS